MENITKRIYSSPKESNNLIETANAKVRSNALGSKNIISTANSRDLSFSRTSRGKSEADNSDEG